MRLVCCTAIAAPAVKHVCAVARQGQCSWAVTGATGLHYSVSSCLETSPHPDLHIYRTSKFAIELHHACIWCNAFKKFRCAVNGKQYRMVGLTPPCRSLHSTKNPPVTITVLHPFGVPHIVKTPRQSPNSSPMLCFGGHRETTDRTSQRAARPSAFDSMLCSHFKGPAPSVVGPRTAKQTW